MSSGNSTLSKFKENVKKTTEKLEGDINKTVDRVTSKLDKSFNVCKKSTAATAKSAAVSSDTVTSSTPQLSETTQASRFVQEASNNENDVIKEGGENLKIIDGDDGSSSASPSSSPSTSLSELLFITAMSLSTVYYTWLYKSDILVNQIPFIVAAHWALLTYFIGSASIAGEKVVFVSMDKGVSDGEKKVAATKDEVSDDNRLVTYTNEEEEEAKAKRTLLRIHYSKKLLLSKKDRQESNPIEEFFTNLKPAGKAIKTPISEGLMTVLTKISPDFKRRKSTIGEIDLTQLAELEAAEGGLIKEEEEKGEELKSYEMGTAALGNTRASKLVRELDYVEPMCTFRGMDFFVGDFPEKEIWKQPLLLNNGLRDAPTLIGNLMLPNGNLVTYLQMPDWFDNWDNIPEEKEDDPPDVKAFKRFFTGDLEYQRGRAKLVPMVVKAPYVVKAISPAPSAMTMHTPRHPVCVKKINKAVDPVTGKTSAALMEFGVDFYTSAAIGRIINIVFPHLGSITIDLALVIESPWDPVAKCYVGDEPSACLGVWRIDKVDFMSFAQFPEQPVEVVEKEIEDIMKSMETEKS